MTSLRKLDRRLKRWQRYYLRYDVGFRPGRNLVSGGSVRASRGYLRAVVAVWNCRARREVP